MEIRDIIRKDIRSLPMDAAGVREKRDKIDRALTSKFWDHIVLDPGQYLRIHIMPLMRFKQDVNFKESYFIDKCERLGLATLENDKEEVCRLRSSIGEMIEGLPQASGCKTEKGLSWKWRCPIPSGKRSVMKIPRD